MKAMLALSRLIDALNERIGRTVTWLILAAVVISAVNAVVVVLPLVPVMAMNGDCGHTAARSRQKISTSPMISMPASSSRP